MAISSEGRGLQEPYSSDHEGGRPVVMTSEDNGKKQTIDLSGWGTCDACIFSFLFNLFLSPSTILVIALHRHCPPIRLHAF